MPASMAKIPMIAKAIGSNPNLIASGAKIGTVNKIIDTESINIPNINHTATINAMIAKVDSPSPRMKSCMLLTTPPIAKRREYIWAQISKNNNGADVLPVSEIASTISPHFNPLTTASSKASRAPIPEASVGVK